MDFDFEEFERLLARMSDHPVDSDEFERFLKAFAKLMDALPPAEVAEMVAPHVPMAVESLRELANDPKTSDEDRRAFLALLNSRNIPADPSKEWRH